MYLDDLLTHKIYFFHRKKVFSVTFHCRARDSTFVHWLVAVLGFRLGLNWKWLSGGILRGFHQQEL